MNGFLTLLFNMWAPNVFFVNILSVLLFFLSSCLLRVFPPARAHSIAHSDSYFNITLASNNFWVLSINFKYAALFDSLKSCNTKLNAKLCPPPPYRNVWGNATFITQLKNSELSNKNSWLYPIHSNLWQFYLISWYVPFRAQGVHYASCVQNH